MGYTLIFDYGTTALKTVLFDADFRVAASETTEYRYETPAPGRIEYAADEYILILYDSGRRVLDRTGVRTLERIAVTGQAETLIFLDAQDEPIGNAIVWLDERAREECDALGEIIPARTVYERTGNLGFDAVMPVAKLLWMRRHRPDVRYTKALLLHDWVLYRLTGEMRAEYGILSCSGYFDIRKKAYDRELLDAAGIDIDTLAQPCPPSVRVGTLTADAQTALGVGCTPVGNGMLDQCAAAYGAGNVRGGIITETTGTVLAIAATLDRFTPENHRIPVLCHGVEDKYLALPYCPTAGILLKWYRDAFLDGLSYADIDREIAEHTRPDGELICLPHFKGRLSPVSDRDARGAFLGVTLETGKYDLARAVMESVAFLLRENLEVLGTFERVISLGGGAKSPLWTQMKADALGVPVMTLKVSEATALGCALGAAVADGAMTLSDAERFAVPDTTYLPSENRRYMDEKYGKYTEYNRLLANGRNRYVE